MLQKDIEQEFRVMKRIPEINWFRVRLSCFSRTKWAPKYERMVKKAHSKIAKEMDL